MTKILVTGASGFIGRNLIPKLCKAGHNVIGVDIESGDVSEKSTWLKYSEADLLIHLAGKIFVPDSWVDPAIFIKCNLMGTIFALDYCRKYDARLIFLSSYLYGNPKTLPIPETAPLVILNPYAISKKMAEEACRFYSDKFNVNIVIFRLFNVYGPGQPESFLLQSIIQQVIANDMIKVRDLEPMRDYIYVDDVVQAILKAVHYKSRFNIFNIGSGISHSVEEIINLIQDLKKTNLPIHSTAERRKDEIMNTVADITKAKNELEWEPQWSLVKGLKEMLSLNESNK